MHWFLNPTRVMHIAGFVTMCEAFLGMEPHMDLFQWLFSRQALSEGKSLMITLVGSFVLQKKPSTSGSYPMYTPYDSNWGSHEEWFYIRNPTEAPFLPFTGRRPER